MIQPDVLVVPLILVSMEYLFVQCRAYHIHRGCCKCQEFSGWGHPWRAEGNWQPS